MSKASRITWNLRNLKNKRNCLSRSYRFTISRHLVRMWYSFGFNSELEP